jgi:hypothetical protein
MEIKKVLVKLFIGLTAFPFCFAMLMIFPGMLMGLAGLLVDIVLYVSWPFTGNSPFKYIDIFGCGIWLPLYSVAALHLYVCQKHDIEIGWPLTPR